MLNWIIDASLKHRALVILVTVLFAVIGGFSLQQLDIDAFPDTTPVMVQVNLSAPGWAPEDLERLASYPIEQALTVHGRKLPPPPSNPMSADRVRWEHIQRVFEQCDRNVSETARRLNMHRRTLQRILGKHAPREH